MAIVSAGRVWSIALRRWVELECSASKVKWPNRPTRVNTPEVPSVAVFKKWLSHAGVSVLVPSRVSSELCTIFSDRPSAHVLPYRGQVPPEQWWAVSYEQAADVWSSKGHIPGCLHLKGKQTPKAKQKRTSRQRQREEKGFSVGPASHRQQRLC